MPPAKTDKPLWKQKINIEQVKSSLDFDLSRLDTEGYEVLTAEDFYRLKMWGVCSQRTPGLHMVRMRITGGKVSATQMRGLSELSARVADGGVHITTRQNLELHSVETRNVRRALDGLRLLGISSRSTCGHTVRNVVGCSLSGICPEETFDTRPTVEAISNFFVTRADHYNSHLPRRLNIYVAGCPSCMTHAQVNDLGFVATRRGGEMGFQFWCAGSLGAQPRLSHLLFGFVPVEEALAVTQAVADVYCEHGFRDKPAKARLKYLIEEWGEEKFAAAVLERVTVLRPGTRVVRSGSMVVLGPDRRPPGGHKGVFPQRQEGYVRIEARVALGDLEDVQMEVLARLSEAHADGYIYLTKEQNAELHWIRSEAVDEVCGPLAEVALLPRGAGGLVDVQVCAGTEWCVWGVGDSRGLATDIEKELASVVENDAAAEPLRVHISGCHHGCAQHQIADIGLVATAVKDGDEKGAGFEIFGGGRLGADPQPAHRLGRVPLWQTSETVTTLLKAYLQERQSAEDFPSFLDRTGRKAPQHFPTQTVSGP
ncbi:MAG: nitrite/sulfite reductase [Actinomycetota bacterium]